MLDRLSYLGWQDTLEGIDAEADVRRGVLSRQLPGFWWRRPAPSYRFAPRPFDVLAQCPKCKTVETVQFVGDTLTPCRKFVQKDGRVYHDCGSRQPCRLHR